jgi:hypothetical protein
MGVGNRVIEEARIVLALKKSLYNKPQLLEYMRKQILHDFLTNLETTTDEEVKEYLKINHGDANKKGQV